MDLARGHQLARIVQSMAHRLPFNCTCLVQSVALVAMLRRRSIPGKMKIGVAKGGKELSAHSWVECGGEILLDSGQHESFIPFAN